MDINEVNGKLKYRHPWELSRTACVLHEITPILQSMDEHAKFISIGAGDMYFEKHILGINKQNTLYAVDIGYDTDKYKLVKEDSPRIKMFGDINRVGDEKFDYAIMLDSLEYMENDAEYLTELSRRMKAYGYMIITVPAYQSLYSEHDENVGNLRRYSIRSFRALITKIPDMKVESLHYFYQPLLWIRFLQKLFKVNIDPDHKVTTGWSHSEHSLITGLVAGTLDLDYMICMSLSRIGIHLPGLSLIAICRKD